MPENINYRKKFRLFLITYILLVSIICSLNIYFNVYGLFSNYQLEYKMVHNDRISKFRWIQDMETTPECFVYGSSNSMRFIPDSLESMTGLKSFNLGLFHARSEDYWCMSNVLINELDKTPKLIFFGLDDWSFSDEPAEPDEVFVGAEKRLAFKKEFSSYLDDYSTFKLRWAQFKASLTFEHFKESISAFLSSIKDSSGFQKSIPVMTDVFYEDGIRKKYGRIDEEDEDITDTCETGTYDMTKYLREVDSTWKTFPVTKNGILDKSHENFEKFSWRRLQLFERTIKLLDDNNCTVAINIMPNQKYFRDVLMTRTTYPIRLLYLKGYLEYLKAKYSNIIAIKDNSDVEYFGGFDYMHPTSVNSSLMLETFRKDFSEYAF